MSNPEKPKSYALEPLGEWLSATFNSLLPRLKAFHGHTGDWAVQASWRRIAVLAVVAMIALLIIGSILGFDEPVVRDTGDLKPVTIDIQDDNGGGVRIQPMIGGKKVKPIIVPPVPSAPTPPDSSDVSHGIQIERGGKRITIDETGVRVDNASSTSHAGPPVAQAAPPSPALSDSDKEAVEDAKAKLAEEKSRLAEQKAKVLEDYHEKIKEAIETAKEDLKEEIASAEVAEQRHTVSQPRVALWDLFKVAIILFFAYLVALKISMQTKTRADAMVKTASETAEQESLKRQLIEARLQTLQAQVEPHFLFNTLASVDYLIETDPARASTMQKNLIQYLRAALPQMREAATTLGREVDLVSAYLEILKVRMDDRLKVTISVPDGLRSAEFPPMMLQSLAENAIKHGLEPKPEGGELGLTAQVIDGDLYVEVFDSGLGFAASGDTAGQGVGLTNIRDRLAILYGGQRGKMIIAPNSPAGSRVTLVVPYQPMAKRPAAHTETPNEGS